MNDVAFAMTVCVNNLTPAISDNGAAIAPRPASSTEPVSDGLPVFHRRMTPESANPVQQPQTIIEIWPYRGGWQCFEGLGVGPYWIGEGAKEDAIGYAKARAKFGRGEIPVLNQD